MTHEPGPFLDGGWRRAERCPEVVLWLLGPGADLEVEARRLPWPDPPYWAFAWASGQALARFVLDAPERVRGRRVVDLGCGSGLAGIAAALAGAAHVVACDVDPLARAAAARNACANGVRLACAASLDEALASRPDVVLAADVCYEPAVAERLLALASDTSAGRALEVLVADPGRRGLPLPAERLAPLAHLRARTLPDLGEPTDGATIHRLVPPPARGQGGRLESRPASGARSEAEPSGDHRGGSEPQASEAHPLGSPRAQGDRMR